MTSGLSLCSYWPPMGSPPTTMDNGILAGSGNRHRQRCHQKG